MNEYLLFILFININRTTKMILVITKDVSLGQTKLYT